MENKIEKDKEGYLPNYIFLFSIAYLISAFIGAFYFPFMQELDCTFANFLAGLGLFFFFGFLLWPLYSFYNPFTFIVFSTLAFLLINGAFEAIIGSDRKGGDIPLDEKGLLKRLKRARILFACSVVVILIITGVFIYSRGNLLNKIDSMQTELDVIEENYERLKEQYNDIRSQKNEMQSELNFWQDHAVIVTEYGEKYHTYGCQYIKGRDFWIYNVEAAIGMGYTPCSVCNPPRP